MGKQLAVLLAILVVCAVAAWLASPPPSRPGVRDFTVDGWTLDVTIDEARAKHGAPVRQNMSGDGLVTEWPHGLVLGTDALGKRARFVMGRTLVLRGEVVGRAPQAEGSFLLRVGGVGGGLVLREEDMEVGYDVRVGVVERFWVRRSEQDGRSERILVHPRVPGR